MKVISCLHSHSKTNFQGVTKRFLMPLQIGQRRNYVREPSILLSAIDSMLVVAHEDDGSDQSDIQKGVGKGRKKELWPLERDGNGNPKLPRLNQNTTGKDLKGIIRAFFTYSYRKLQSFINFTCSLFHIGTWTGNENDVVPWGQVAKAPSQLIEAWDDKIVVGDPSKMTRPELTSLYHYLMEKGSDQRELKWIQPKLDDDEEVVRKSDEERSESKTEWYDEDGDSGDIIDVGQWSEGQGNKEENKRGRKAQKLSQKEGNGENGQGKEKRSRTERAAMTKKSYATRYGYSYTHLCGFADCGYLKDQSSSVNR